MQNTTKYNFNYYPREKKIKLILHKKKLNKIFKINHFLSFKNYR